MGVPPYWASWAVLAQSCAGQSWAIAAGKRVLDIGSGSGLVASVVLRCAALLFAAADIDVFALAAIAHEANNLTPEHHRRGRRRRAFDLDWWAIFL